MLGRLWQTISKLINRSPTGRSPSPARRYPSVVAMVFGNVVLRYGFSSGIYTLVTLHAPNALVQESVRAFFTGWYKELMTELPLVRND